MLKSLRKYKKSSCLFILFLFKFGTIQPFGNLFLALYHWYQVKNLRSGTTGANGLGTRILSKVRNSRAIVSQSGRRLAAGSQTMISATGRRLAAGSQAMVFGTGELLGAGLMNGTLKQMPALGTLSEIDLSQKANMLLGDLLAQLNSTIKESKAEFLAELDKELRENNPDGRLNILKRRTQAFIDETIYKSFKEMAASLRDLLQEDGELAQALKASIQTASHEIRQELIAHINSAEFQQAITDAGNHFVDNVGEVVHAKFKKIAVTTVLSVVAIILSWYGLKLLYNQIDRKLNQPKIIIESSFKSTFERIKNLIFKKPINFRPMVFAHDLETRLINIIETTQSISSKIKEGKTNVKYRNLFLFGAPGTGKTMFAKELAKRSGMDYAMITGSSFFRDDAGIREMDELFSWAIHSKKGFMLIIDEADSFLIERSTLNPDSKPYQLLTHFLDYTGTRNNKFMLVFCTNHKHMLDSAMKRRIDDYIEIPLPKTDERFKVLWLYREQILFDIRQNGLEFVEVASQSLNDKKILEIAKKTEGLSNGDLEGIINNIKTDADVTPSGLVDNDIIDKVVDQILEKSSTLGRKDV